MRLADLRKAKGVTQVELAAAGEINQPAVSRIEKQDDMLVSTLRRYLEGLGLSLELVATSEHGHRVVIDL